MKIYVFTEKNCSFCIELKQDLKNNNIDFIEVDVDEKHEEWEQVLIKIGIDIVPVVYVDVLSTYIIPSMHFQSNEDLIIFLKKFALKFGE